MTTPRRQNGPISRGTQVADPIASATATRKPSTAWRARP
jgi:hypothetical protein